MSFGPDLVIGAPRPPSGAERDRADGEVTCDSGRAASQCRDQTVFRRPDVDSSPSADGRPRADRRTSAPSPGLSVGETRRSTCVGLDVGPRRGGEPRHVGNGSVRGRPLSPPTPTPVAFTRSHPASQSLSLGRSKLPRRLPVPIGAGQRQRRSPGPGLRGGLAGRLGGSSPRDAALPGNQAADCCTPVSLAELLAPPFGDTAAALRQLRQTVKTVTDSAPQPANANCIFDDDSGTDI